MQEVDVEIEYVSAPTDFDSLTISEPEAIPAEPAATLAQPAELAQPAAPMEDPDSPQALDRGASPDMDEE